MHPQLDLDPFLIADGPFDSQQASQMRPQR